MKAHPCINPVQRRVRKSNLVNFNDASFVIENIFLAFIFINRAIVTISCLENSDRVYVSSVLTIRWRTSLHQPRARYQENCEENSQSKILFLGSGVMEILSSVGTVHIGHVHLFVSKFLVAGSFLEEQDKHIAIWF